MSWNEEGKWDFCCPLLEEGFFPPYMDARHVELIYRLVKSGLFKNILEIGSWNGFSTSAFVQAQIDGADFQLTVCDIEIRDRLKQVLRKSPAEVTVLEMKSTVAIHKKYDLILVDGDHRLSAVAPEIVQLLRCNTPNILAHDVFVQEKIDNTFGASWYEGARHLADVFRHHTAYQHIEDHKKRPGEWTERGLFFASRWPETFKSVKDIWEEFLGA